MEPECWWGWLPTTSPPTNRKKVRKLITPSLNHDYKTSHYPLQVQTHFEGISPLWSSLPGKARKWFFSTSPRTLSLRFNLVSEYRGWIWLHSHGLTLPALTPIWDPDLFGASKSLSSIPTWHSDYHLKWNMAGWVQITAMILLLFPASILPSHTLLTSIRGISWLQAKGSGSSLSPLCPGTHIKLSCRSVSSLSTPGSW